jgi:hypothetical protein
MAKPKGAISKKTIEKVKEYFLKQDNGNNVQPSKGAVRSNSNKS